MPSADGSGGLESSLDDLVAKYTWGGYENL